MNSLVCIAFFAVAFAAVSACHDDLAETDSTVVQKRGQTQCTDADLISKRNTALGKVKGNVALSTKTSGDYNAKLQSAQKSQTLDSKREKIDNAADCDSVIVDQQ